MISYLAQKRACLAARIAFSLGRKFEENSDTVSILLESPFPSWPFSHIEKWLVIEIEEEGKYDSNTAHSYFYRSFFDAKNMAQVCGENGSICFIYDLDCDTYDPKYETVTSVSVVQFKERDYVSKAELTALPKAELMALSAYWDG